MFAAAPKPIKHLADGQSRNVLPQVGGELYIWRHHGGAAPLLDERGRALPGGVTGGGVGRLDWIELVPPDFR